MNVDVDMIQRPSAPSALYTVSQKN